MKTPPQKRKQQQTQSDVQVARGRLRGALSLQNQEVDDISEDYEEEDEEEEVMEPQPVVQVKQRGRPRKIPIAQPLTLKRYSPPLEHLTPSKRRKRERELAAAAGHNKIQAESFVMKLFDRTLDLSKYTEQTPLYPICRAWIANQPRNPCIRSYRQTRSPSPVQRKDNAGELLTQLRKGNVQDVTSLPKPKRTDLPKLAPQQEPNRFSAADDLIKPGDCLNEAEKEELMSQHLSKWKRIKTDWHKHTKRFQQRNDVNFHIIQELFKP